MDYLSKVYVDKISVSNMHNHPSVYEVGVDQEEVQLYSP